MRRTLLVIVVVVAVLGVIGIEDVVRIRHGRQTVGRGLGGGGSRQEGGLVEAAGVAGAIGCAGVARRPCIPISGETPSLLYLKTA